MNCLYITLFFNIVAGIVQTFIKSWNQLLYPRVLPFVVRDQRWPGEHQSFLRRIHGTTSSMVPSTEPCAMRSTQPLKVSTRDSPGVNAAGAFG